MADELTDLFAHLADRLEKLGELLFMVGDRFKNNVGDGFTKMTVQGWIRLIMIVGAYCLMRPYILKLGAKNQIRQLEKEHDESEAAYQANKISPNDLRDGTSRVTAEIPDPSDDEGEEGTSSAADWGKKARRRQRETLKKLIEMEEKRLHELQGDDEDKDIEEFLVG